MTTHTVLRIDASARKSGSATRALTDAIVDTLSPTRIITRDLADMPLPQVDEAWVGANFTPPEDRTEAQRDKLTLSDDLVAEVRDADTLVIGLPVYNFNLPASLKTWVDQIARAGVTFRYTAEGPEGLMTGKKAIVAYASGGTPLGSEIDHGSTYLRFILGFIGITDVTFVTDEAEAVKAAA